jgi:hypothetical protein
MLDRHYPVCSGGQVTETEQLLAGKNAANEYRESILSSK